MASKLLRRCCQGLERVGSVFHDCANRVFVAERPPASPSKIGRSGRDLRVTYRAEKWSGATGCEPAPPCAQDSGLGQDSHAGAVPTTVPAACQDRAFAANRSQVARSPMSLRQLNSPVIRKMSKKRASVWQTSAFSLSATSPFDSLRSFRASASEEQVCDSPGPRRTAAGARVSERASQNAGARFSRKAALPSIASAVRPSGAVTSASSCMPAA